MLHSKVGTVSNVASIVPRRLLALALTLAFIGSLLTTLSSSRPAAAAPDTTGLFRSSFTPMAVTTSKRSVNLGVRFTASQDGKITALQFYRSSRQKKAYVGSLWSTNGKLLGRATFPKASRAGWQTVALAKPVSVKKGTKYVASYLASDGQFSSTRDAFVRTYTQNGLTVPRKGGVYRYRKSSVVPSKPSAYSSNYLVDVVYMASAAQPTPTVKPTPTASSPVPTPTTTSPTGTPAPTSSGGALWVHSTISANTVRAALGKRVFFGHQSVGAQVLKGVTAFSKEAGLGTPTYPDPESTTLPSSGGFFAQSYVGENGDPLGKLAEFDRILRSGVANRIDVAVIKLCYADIRTNNGNDPVEVFQAYKSTLSALERDYPNVTFLFATQPIVQAVNSDAPHNIPRGVFNNLMRAEYRSTGRLWDVAAIESTTLDGKRVQGTYQGQVFDALNPEFASPDQRHIYGAGEKALAGPLLDLIAKS